MLQEHIRFLLSDAMQHTPTPSQEELLTVMSDFIANQNYSEILLIKGYAGTGKTTMVYTMVQALAKLEINCILLAPTGRAAKVLSNYSKRPAYTIHKRIYRQKSSKDAFASFAIAPNMSNNTIFIVDEASMIANESFEQSIFGSGKLLEDLMVYVQSGIKCKLVLIGDTAQLPPVGLRISPALEREQLENFRVKVREVFLSDIVRQSEVSGILKNATLLREIIDEFSIPDYPTLEYLELNDVKRIAGSRLIEEIQNSYDTIGYENTMVVTRTNKQANRYNQGIRNKILYRENEIDSGDFLMVVKNNYHWIKENDRVDFIANGDILRLVRKGKYEERYGFRFLDCTLEFIDYEIEVEAKIMLDVLSLESASLDGERQKEFFYKVCEDYEHLTNKKKKYEAVREDPFFNALQVKFAYAITCHKAQGGQWKSIFLDQDFFKPEMLDKEYLRWLYTGITRASEKLYLVNFKNEFFGGKEL